MANQPVVLCFSGKRKSGKDFICSRLQKQLESRGFRTVVRGISYPLKEEYAQLHNMDADRLKFDYEYKEVVRKSMVEFGERIRAKEPYYFCRKTMANIDQLESYKFVLISDCRRPTDLEFFRQNYRNCRLIRVYCKDEVRMHRGFVFTEGIDDQETECSLDSFDSWHTRIENNGDLGSLDEQLEKLVAEFL